jgi:hypothetical protein
MDSAHDQTRQVTGYPVRVEEQRVAHYRGRTKEVYQEREGDRMSKEVSVTGDGGYGLWELYMTSRSAYEQWPKDDPGREKLKKALKPGSKIIQMFALSVRILHADGSVEVIERETPFETHEQVFEGGRPPWADNGPRREDGSRHVVASMRKGKD